jgi:hypothetical protein
MTTQTDLAAAVQSFLSARGLKATVRFQAPFVQLSREVFYAGQVGEVRSIFRFDGDLVLLRGIGKAAADLEAKISQARHEGLEVL